MRPKSFIKDFYLYILLFVLVSVGSVYVIWKLVPEYSKKQLPRLAYVKPFSFLNQDSVLITRDSIANKVAIVEFFFTTCEGICPKMNRNMFDIYKAFQKDSNLVILSHTVDPETDTPAQLKRYADSLGVTDNYGGLRWYFLTGNKLDLYKQARESYNLDDPNNNVGDIDDQFIHTQFFALVDRKGSVRKVYDGLLLEELDELKKDIADIEAGKYQE